MVNQMVAVYKVGLRQREEIGLPFTQPESPAAKVTVVLRRVPAPQPDLDGLFETVLEALESSCGR